MLVVLVLIALPLGHAGPREGRFSRLIYGVGGYIFYLNGLMMARKLLEEGQVPELLGMWWLHLAVVALFIWFFRRKYSTGKRLKDGCPGRA